MAHLRTYRRADGIAWPRSCRPRRGDYELVRRIREHSGQLRPLSDREITDRARQLRDRVAGGVAITTADVVTTGCALVNEATFRILGVELYDVQLLAGLVLSTGAVAEMQTGEGKTLAAALPAFLAGLEGKGVHLATVNGYLAQRDYHLLRPVYQMLDLSVGILRDRDSPGKKRSAYACDITYGTGYEFGFDYLRDQLARQNQPVRALGESYRAALRGERREGRRTVQQKHAFAIVDEIDSVLIDEANTPLILSNATDDPAEPTPATPAVYRQALATARQLMPERDFVLDRGKRQVSLTERGAQTIFAGPHRAPRSGLQRPWAVYVEQALRADLLLQRNVDYVVRQGKVMIVDQYTGRIFADRTWRDGLHQVLEAKEGVAVTDEKRSVMRISRQRYFQMYERLCGMTGTASGHEHEFASFYKLPVVTIPVRVPCERKHLATRFFATGEAKWQALVREVGRRHKRGQPVLVGTRTIELSQLLSEQLQAAGLSHCVLNGVQDEDEALLIARAGQGRNITIATNMAGRGTDIKLSDDARSAGGLHVLGTEHHDSQRIDRQLIGRAARQGDPGSSQFFAAADDELIAQCDPQLVRALKRDADSRGIVERDYSRAIRRLQQKIERRKFALRRRLYRQEQWLNQVVNTLTEPMDQPPERRQTA